MPPSRPNNHLDTDGFALPEELGGHLLTRHALGYTPENPAAIDSEAVITKATNSTPGPMRGPGVVVFGCEPPHRCHVSRGLASDACLSRTAAGVRRGTQRPQSRSLRGNGAGSG